MSSEQQTVPTSVGSRLLPLPQDQVPELRVLGWGLTWRAQQLPLLVLQGGHVIARVLSLILGR